MICARLVLLSLLALGVAGAAAARTDDPPRLFRVTGNDPAGRPIVFYLMGVTHNGLPIEYDEYFRDRVMPAFRTAAHYSYENATLPSKIAPCAVPLVSSHGRAAVEALRARLVDLTVLFFEAIDKRVLSPMGRRSNRFSWREYAESSTNNLSEFEMVIELQTRRAQLSALEGRSGQRSPVALQEQVAKTLATSRPDIVAPSLDTPEDLVGVYCDSGEERLAFIESALENDDRFDRSWKVSKKQIDAELAEAERDFAATFRERRLVGTFESAGQFSESLICERNVKWMGKMINPDAPGSWFYAVGLDHLFPAAGPSASCAGLLDDLGRIGWTVSPVRATT